MVSCGALGAVVSPVAPLLVTTSSGLLVADSRELKSTPSDEVVLSPKV
jgi:hypothetical protein